MDERPYTGYEESPLPWPLEAEGEGVHQPCFTKNAEEPGGHGGVWLVAYSTARPVLNGDCDMKSSQSLLCTTFGYDTTRCPISGILRRCAGR
jgi:hypothetical protein